VTHLCLWLLSFHRIQAAFAVISALMTISAFLQISLVSRREWACLFGHVERLVPKGLSSSFSFTSLVELEEAKTQTTRQPTFHRQFTLPAFQNSNQQTSDFLSGLRESNTTDDPDNDDDDDDNAPNDNKLKSD
jgi:hypothetical protein